MYGAPFVERADVADASDVLAADLRGGARLAEEARTPRSLGARSGAGT